MIQDTSVHNPCMEIPAIYKPTKLHMKLITPKGCYAILISHYSQLVELTSSQSWGLALMAQDAFYTTCHKPSTHTFSSGYELP